MSVEINTLHRDDVERLISTEIYPTLSANEQKAFHRIMDATTIFWVGIYEGKLKAMWGLAPPTMLGNQAYLWLHIFDSIDDCLFLFVRNSQRAIEEALLRYPIIFGHCHHEDKRAQRWLRWLGAEFQKTPGDAVPFVIKTKDANESAIAS